MTFNPAPFERSDTNAENYCPPLVDMGSPKHWFYAFPNGINAHVAGFEVYELPGVRDKAGNLHIPMKLKEPLVSYDVQWGPGDYDDTWIKRTYRDFRAVLQCLESIKNSEVA